jgi:transposase-like protein
MTGPDCAAAAITALRRRPTLGYPLFRCRACGRTFTARTGTPFNHLHGPPDIALLVVLWRLGSVRTQNRGSEQPAIGYPFP